MPRVIDPAKLDRAAALYASGKTFTEAATEVGLNSESVRLALKRRGVEARPRSQRPANNRLALPDETIANLYLEGASEKSLAAQFGVSRTVITRRLNEQGVERRGQHAASVVHQGTLSNEEKARRVRAAHAAKRGVTNSEAHMIKVARGKEAVQYGGRTSPGTDRLCEMMVTAGMEHTREKAVGRYNVDVALSAYPVAVEVLGGNWHGNKPIHDVRTPYILNRGWHLVFVWDVKRCKVGPGALNYIVGFAKKSGFDPPASGEYRVIRGDGQLLATGQVDDDEFPLVPPSVAGLD